MAQDTIQDANEQLDAAWTALIDFQDRLGPPIPEGAAQRVEKAIADEVKIYEEVKKAWGKLFATRSEKETKRVYEETRVEYENAKKKVEEAKEELAKFKRCNRPHRFRIWRSSHFSFS